MIAQQQDNCVNVVIMLAHRLQRLTNMKTTLDPHVVFAGGGVYGEQRSLSNKLTYTTCRLNAGWMVATVCNVTPLFNQQFYLRLLKGWVHLKHDKITQCCFNIGPLSATLAQHLQYIGWTPCPWYFVWHTHTGLTRAYMTTYRHPPLTW